MTIICVHCGHEIESDPHDTTYSNIETARASVGQHTGDIYKCEGCEELTINDFLSGDQYAWTY
ncbi:hypothetical protein [Gilvimarinus chinensis]|uniref:hypothetical protein n=1 Tax=Gilvimarinus chinensis TaxID=396005 RepID=UPI00037043B1|nr:hypothetical protein [Gilvimarinus chinensis]